MASEYLQIFLSKTLEDLGFAKCVGILVINYGEYTSRKLCGAVSPDVRKVQLTDGNWVSVHTQCWQLGNQWSYIEHLKVDNQLTWPLIREAWHGRALLSLNLLETMQEYHPASLTLWYRTKFQHKEISTSCFSHVYNLLKKAESPHFDRDVQQLVAIQLRYHLLSNNAKFLFNALNLPFRVLGETKVSWLK